jgi:hypothetical protein
LSISAHTLRRKRFLTRAGSLMRFENSIRWPELGHNNALQRTPKPTRAFVHATARHYCTKARVGLGTADFQRYAFDERRYPR